jgi:hypothetical protein
MKKSLLILCVIFFSLLILPNESHAQRSQKKASSALQHPRSPMDGVLPTVATTSATNLAPSSATLNGQVNPNGSIASVQFEWGTDNTLSTFDTTTSQPCSWVTSALVMTDNITGLSANTVYYFRVVARNGGGEVLGSIVSFSTNVAVAVTAPNGLESWAAGTQHSITWTSTDVDAVMLEYTTDDGDSWVTITQSTPASAGSFLWTVPAALSVHCKVRITDVNDGTHSDMSDKGFTIYKPTGLFVATENNLGITTMNGEFGCSWGDFNGDGYLDLFLPGVWYPNTLYRNDGGSHFTDVSNSMGIAGPFNGLAMGAVWADFNGDGRLDLLCTDAGLKLYRNDGNVFTDISAASNLNSIDPGAMLSGTAVADFDNDGDLDIALAGGVGIALPIHILRNDNGVFTDVAPAMGITSSLECWAPEWVDINNDGKLDLWLPTIRTPGTGCMLLINQGGQLVPSDPAVTGIQAKSAIVSCWGDFNNDGYMDLFLIPYSGDNDGVAKLYRNNGDGTFTDVAQAYGLNQAFSSARGVYWGDYDNDGSLDLLIGNWTGPQYLFHNDGDHFTEVGAQTGAGFIGRFRSTLFVDYDNDGNLDINYNEGPRNTIGQPKLLLHNSGNSNHWAGIVPRAFESNTAAIGARITLVAGSLRQIRDIQGGGSGITTGDLRALFGLGNISAIDSVIVRWPTGKTSVFKNLKLDSYNILMELPTVATLPATNVASMSATLNGTVNPNGSAASAYLEWGTDNTLSTFSTTASLAAGSGKDDVSVTADLAGLSANTTYYYRIVGENSAGAQLGSILSFQTLPLSPQQQVQLILNQVNALVTSHVLARVEGLLLTATLDQTSRDLERGRNGIAIVDLRAFIIEVQLYMRFGLLKASQAQPLIDEANTAINMIRNSGGNMAVSSSEEQSILSQTTEVEGTISHGFWLSQNSPNPFNPTTEIQFSVLTDGHAALKVFNSLGQETATLFDGEAEAGQTYKTTFNAAALPSGVYFARLDFGIKYLVKKMLLMK